MMQQYDRASEVYHTALRIEPGNVLAKHALRALTEDEGGASNSVSEEESREYVEGLDVLSCRSRTFAPY